MISKPKSKSKVRNEVTSKRLATIASKILDGQPYTSKEVLALAGSVLTQAEDKSIHPDTKILNWIEENAAQVVFRNGFYIESSDAKKTGSNQSLRKAAKEAMKQKKVEG